MFGAHFQRYAVPAALATIREAVDEMSAAAAGKHLESVFSGCPGGSAAKSAFAIRLFTRRRFPSLARSFWPVVAREWSGFDNLDHRAFCRMFHVYRHDYTQECMADEDLEALDALPDEFEIHRGQATGRDGLSWTLETEVAEGFCHGHRSIPVRDPVLLTASVRKADVLFYCGERDEAEVVIPHRGVLRGTTSRPYAGAA